MNPVSWLPDRKVLAGGIAGILAWLLVFIGNKYGMGITPDVQSLLTGAIGWAVAYLVPSSVRDVINHLNDDIVQIAAADPNSNVSERTMVLPAATKVVAASSPSPVVALPPAMTEPEPVNTKKKGT